MTSNWPEGEIVRVNKDNNMIGIIIDKKQYVNNMQRTLYSICLMNKELRVVSDDKMEVLVGETNMHAIRCSHCNELILKGSVYYRDMDDRDIDDVDCIAICCACARKLLYFLKESLNTKPQFDFTSKCYLGVDTCIAAWGVGYGEGTNKCVSPTWKDIAYSIETPNSPHCCNGCGAPLHFYSRSVIYKGELYCPVCARNFKYGGGVEIAILNACYGGNHSKCDRCGGIVPNTMVYYKGKIKDEEKILCLPCLNQVTNKHPGNWSKGLQQWHIDFNNEYNIEMKGGLPMKPNSLLNSLVDEDTRILAEEVLDVNGNLNLNDYRVQKAILLTDGFKKNLLTILKEEREEKSKRDK